MYGSWGYGSNSYGGGVAYPTAQNYYQTCEEAVKMVQPSPAKSVGRTLLQSLTAVPVFSGIGSFYKILSEIIKVPGTYDKILTSARTFTDSVKATGSVLRQTARTIIESVKASDTLQRVLSAVKSLVESIVFSANALFSASRTLIERLVVIPVYGIIKALTRTFAEIVRVISAITIQAARIFAEALKTADNIAKQAGKVFVEVFTESVNVISSWAGLVARVFSENVSVVEQSVEALRTKLLTEAVSIAEQMWFSIGKVFTENPVVDWAKEVYRIVVYSENLAVRVIFVPLTIGKLLLETVVGITDWLFEKTQFIELVDSVKAGVKIFLSVSRTLVERVIATGLTIFSISRTFIEKTIIGDIVAPLFGRVLAEIAAVGDALGSWVIGKAFVEAVITSGIYQRVWTVLRTFSEVVSVVGSVAAVGAKVLVESVSAVGALAKWSIGKLLIQPVRVIDTIRFRKTQYKALIDSIKASALMTAMKTQYKVLSEAVAVVGSFIIGTISKMLIEPVKVVVSYLSAWTLSRVYSETIRVLGNAYNQAGKIFTESVSAASEFVLGTISKVLIEAVKIYDTIAKSLPKVFTEAVAVVGEAFNQAGKIFAEVLSVVGSFILGTISKLFIEPVIMAYDFITAGVFYKTLSEAFSVAGNVFNQAGKIFVEAVSVVGEFILGTISKMLIEIVKVSKILNFAITRVFAEVVNVLGAVYSKVGRIFSEVLGVVNPTIIKAVGRTFIENLAAGWAKIKLVLNGIQVGLWNKVARITGSWSPVGRIKGAWKKISRND